jgi:pyruvate dehydrogenase E2 component (dihydrolipoamide acetyltransferase)
MTEIVMPRLSDTMEEGTILRWLKRDGEEVARGEELAEIETDKATMTYESDQAGALQIVASEGSTLAVGEVIARVGATAPSEVAQEAHTGGERAAGEHPDAGTRIKASPLARRIAGERGIDLRALTGTGPGGRIVKADVLAPVAGATRIEGVMTAKGETTTVALSRTQQTIARRMAESKATIPDFTLQIDVNMEECVKLRAQLKQLSHHNSNPEPAATDAGEQRGRDQLKAPTYNDMVVKACALALREHPSANGSYRDGRLQLHSRVNVGVAVAAENALVVPTVFDADEKSLGEIARETHTLGERVRTAAITPPELGGGTFTVSNLGMYGVKSFTAIINPPQAGILSVGALAQRAVVLSDSGADGGGVVVARSTMTLTLACDHRILYGAEAAQFLARIRELLETPSALTL